MERPTRPPVPHALSRRRLNPDEEAFLRQYLPRGAWGIADGVLFFCWIAGTGVVLGMLVGAAAIWLARTIGWPIPGGTVLTLTSLAGFVAAIRPAASLAGTVRKDRRHIRADLAQQEVEVLRVEQARVLEQEQHNDEGPLYYFDIGGGRILYLGGQWLYDTGIYGEQDEELDEELDEEQEASLSEPTPVSSFTLSRVPISGHVLRIDPHGEPLVLLGAIKLKTRLPDWVWAGFGGEAPPDSVVLEGDFDDLVKLSVPVTPR